MTRLNFTAEGFSEERFVRDVLAPHLVQFDVVVDVRKALTSRKLRKRGGIVSYQKFRGDVLQWIKEQPRSFHTTFIDLYGLDSDFPQYQETMGQEPYRRVKAVETALGEDINHHTFIPFIQLHEYEALLFSAPDTTTEWLQLYNTRLFDSALGDILAAAGGNPELINEGPETAPSKRILSLCNTYDKVDDGILILKEIGLPALRAKCTHFDQWISQLEKIGITSAKTTTHPASQT